MARVKESSAAAPAAAAALAGEADAAIAALPAATTPALRTLRRDLSRTVRGWPAQEVLEVAEGLLRGGGPARRFVAYELLSSHRAALASLDARAVERLGRGMASWGEVDGFGCLVAGPAWRNRQLPDAAVLGWAAAADRWWRRAALVATVPLNDRSQGRGDAARTLAVCSALLDDRDDMVVKALSWALRALAKRDPEPVRAFLRESGGRLAARVVREVSHKLATGRKTPRRRAWPHSSC